MPHSARAEKPWRAEAAPSLPRSAGGGHREVTMRQTGLLLLSLAFLVCPHLAAQEQAPSFDIQEFLARHEDGLTPLNRVYDEIANENLPLRDEMGQTLTRRHIEDRRQALQELRGTIRQLRTNPRDLVLTTRLFLETEALVDDLFDLSQIAYDNDREDLGKRFSDLRQIFERHNQLIEAYTLRLAGEKEEEIRELERQNQALREKLKEAMEQLRAKSATRR
jgi:hypothetical protein